MKGPRHQVDQCVMFLYAFTHFWTRNFKSFVLLFKPFVDLLYKNSQSDFLLVVFLSLILFFIPTKEISIIVTKYVEVHEKALFKSNSEFYSRTWLASAGLYDAAKIFLNKIKIGEGSPSWKKWQFGQHSFLTRKVVVSFTISLLEGTEEILACK